MYCSQATGSCQGITDVIPRCTSLWNWWSHGPPRLWLDLKSSCLQIRSSHELLYFFPTAILCGQQKNLCAVLENTNHYSSCVPSPCLAQCHTSWLQTTSSLWYTAHSLWSCCSISIYYPNTSSGFTCFSFFLVSAEGGLMWLETLNSSKEKLQSHKKSIVPSE